MFKSPFSDGGNVDPGLSLVFAFNTCQITKIVTIRDSSQAFHVLLGKNFPSINFILNFFLLNFH